MQGPVDVPFVSDLGVGGFLLVREAGWDPLDVARGDCSYDLGSQRTSRRDDKPLHWISDALASGHRLAVERMRDRAAQIGGEGVLGVRVTGTDLDIATDPGAWPTRHLTAVGTVVRRRGVEGHATVPFTSSLSGRETWALTRAGCRPLAIVFGFGVFHSRSLLRRPDRCAEMTELSQAVTAARRQALADLRRQGNAVAASGVVGVSVNLEIAPGPTAIFSAIGTAIRIPTGGEAGPSPELVISLNDPLRPRRAGS